MPNENKKKKDGSEKSLQMKTSLGIGLVFILVGLPLWWKTTTTYRAFLPHGEIENLAEHKILCNIPVSLILCQTERGDDGEQLQQSLEDLLMKGKLPGRSFTVQYSVNARKCSKKLQQAIAEATTADDLDKKLEVFESGHILDLELFLLPRRTDLPYSVYIGRSNRAYAFVDTDGVSQSLDRLANITRSILVNEESLMKSYAMARGYNIKKVDREIMRAMRSTPGYELSFSLLNPDPATRLATWDIKAAVQDFLQPFLDKLSVFADFSVGSQVLYYTGLAFKPKHSKENGYHYLSAQQLPLVINPVEAKLGSHVTTNPTINFLVYAPISGHSPLYIHNEKGDKSATNAFFSPRWGGFLIQNPPELDGNTTYDINEFEVDMKVAMEVFLSQLRMLIGVPTHIVPEYVQLAGTDHTAITDWELAGLLRKRTLENLGTSSATLFSLSRLVEQINNMVIKDDIAHEVYQAVNYLKSCHEFLQSGEFNKAFLVSKKAIAASETAFFDPSLLELLYFPEDQKFAIYIPLFLPIGIPVAASLFKALKWLKTKRKAKED